MKNVLKYSKHLYVDRLNQASDQCSADFGSDTIERPSVAFHVSPEMIEAASPQSSGPGV